MRSLTTHLADLPIVYLAAQFRMLEKLQKELRFPVIRGVVGNIKSRRTRPTII
jgi:hypothetical protein